MKKPSKQPKRSVRAKRGARSLERVVSPLAREMAETMERMTLEMVKAAYDGDADAIHTEHAKRMMLYVQEKLDEHKAG